MWLTLKGHTVAEITAQVLSDREAESMGMGTIVNGGQIASPVDNVMVEEMIASGTLPQTDKEGRPIISFSQYQRLRKKGNLSNYSMWMERPGTRGAYTMQASKYMKFYRKGWEAVGATPVDRHSVADLVDIGMSASAAQMAVQSRTPVAKRAAPQSVDNGLTMFRCNDKYPDCGRFFDNRKGLQLHWNKDHGEVASLSRKKVAS